MPTLRAPHLRTPTGRAAILGKRGRFASGVGLERFSIGGGRVEVRRAAHRQPRAFSTWVTRQARWMGANEWGRQGENGGELTGMSGM